MSHPVRQRLLLLLLISSTIGCDRVTKHVATSTLTHLPMQSFLADTVRLEYVENTGAFLGLGSAWRPEVRIGIFTVGASLLLLVMGLSAIRQRWSGAALAGLTLVLAGGGSNIADRVSRGSVVDFLNIGIGPLRTGIFNVADMALMLGVALIVYAAYRAGPALGGSPRG